MFALGRSQWLGVVLNGVILNGSLAQMPDVRPGEHRGDKCSDDDLLGALSECSQLDSSILDLPAFDIGDIALRECERDESRRPLLDQSKPSSDFYSLAKGLPRKAKKVLWQKGRRLQRKVLSDKLKSHTDRSRLQRQRVRATNPVNPFFLDSHPAHPTHQLTRGSLGRFRL